MGIVRNAWQVVREHWRAYITINILYYGLVVAGMAYSLANPGLQQELIGGVGESLGPGGSLEGVTQAYDSGNVAVAAAVTFAVNLFAGALLVLTLPSLVIPYFGVLMGLYRAVLWGLLLAPQGALALPMIPHSITLLLEGQGYILAMLGAYTIWRGFFRPQAYGASGRLAGYLAGLKRCARIYVLVVLVLAVAAIYEAIEVILMMTLARGG